jgi:hypothetical protein
VDGFRFKVQELNQRQMDLETEELEAFPKEENEELVLLY